MKKTIKGPNRLKLVLDPTQVFPDDPGGGTPAMVYRHAPDGSIIGSSTFDRAADEGSLVDDHGCDAPLDQGELDWLTSVEHAVDAMYDGP